MDFQYIHLSLFNKNKTTPHSSTAYKTQPIKQSSWPIWYTKQIPPTRYMNMNKPYTYLIVTLITNGTLHSILLPYLRKQMASPRTNRISLLLLFHETVSSRPSQSAIAFIIHLQK